MGVRLPLLWWWWRWYGDSFILQASTIVLLLLLSSHVGVGVLVSAGRMGLPPILCSW